jgi:hypothetical protein
MSNIDFSVYQKIPETAMTRSAKCSRMTCQESVAGNETVSSRSRIETLAIVVEKVRDLKQNPLGCARKAERIIHAQCYCSRLVCRRSQ